MKMFLTLILMMASFSLLAQEQLESLGLVKTPEKTIFLYKGAHDQRDSLVVFNGEKSPGHFYISDSAAHPLKRVSPLQFEGSPKVYLVSVWGKGAHGETVRVMDPALENMELASFNSSWPVKVEVKEGVLIMKGKGEAIGDSTTEYKDLVKTWAPAP